MSDSGISLDLVWRFLGGEDSVRQRLIDEVLSQPRSGATLVDIIDRDGELVAQCNLEIILGLPRAIPVALEEQDDFAERQLAEARSAYRRAGVRRH